MVEVLRPIERVIVHCSDTPDYTLGFIPYDYNALDVAAWHRARGWSDIGYHWFIKRGGLIEAGRDVARVGAHTQGHNTGSIGVCYAGRLHPTNEQIAAFITLARKFKADYGVGVDAWFGHNDFTTGKTCPGFKIAWLKDFLVKAGV